MSADILGTSNICKNIERFLLGWIGVDLNHRHVDFQSIVLPTELPIRNSFEDTLGLFLHCCRNYLRNFLYTNTEISVNLPNGTHGLT